MNDMTPSNPRAADRRRIILETAEALFARKGIDAVSLNEINKAAGQKNTSALHYHFGSKEKLIDAILYQEFESIVARLNSEFDALESSSGVTARDVIVAATTPFIELVSSMRGRNYLRIMVQLLDRNPGMPFLAQPESVEKVRTRIYASAEPFMAHLSESVKFARLIMFASTLFRTLVIYAMYADEVEGSPQVNFALLVSVLHDSLEQIIFAPLSEHTRRIDCA